MRSFSGVRLVTIIMLFAFCITVIPAPALYAGMMDTTAVVENDSADVRARLNRMLERKQVRQVLEDRGVSVAEAQARVDTLSDDQLRYLAGELDSLPSGQGAGAVLGVAVFVFLVLLVTDILGFTDVFPFVVKQR